MVHGNADAKKTLNQYSQNKSKRCGTLDFEKKISLTKFTKEGLNQLSFHFIVFLL